jgi:probable HAF family extracellular repeat protein
MVGLGFLSSDVKSPSSTVSGVSADGSVVVGNSSNGVTIEAFRWTQNNGMVGLGFLTLDRPFPYSIAVDLSADGSVVVGESNIPFPHDSTFDTAAFRWTQEAAFRWTQEDGKVVLVTDDPGNYLLEASYVNAVSADGSVIIGSFPYTSYRGGRNVAFRWTDSTGMVSLGFLRPAPPFTTLSRSDATLLSADGSIVFGNSDSSLFRWTESTGMVNLKSVLIASGTNLNGWRLSSINAVSADGFTIVGNGINPSGQSEGWVANLSPEPIPEPLTILGSIAAIAFAAGFERKFNKNKPDEKDPDA